MEHLTLTHKDNPSFEERDDSEDRTEWRKLLRSFSNVKTLCVRRGLVGALSRCLRLDDEEHPLELLPELQELIYPGSSEADDAFTPFIIARRNVGRPVTLIED